jgi:hypothetical protein
LETYGQPGENIDEFSDRTLKNPEFWSSTVTDTILRFTAGIIAALAVGTLIVATAPVSVPIAILMTIGISVLVGAGFQSIGLNKQMDKAITSAFGWVEP